MTKNNNIKGKDLILFHGKQVLGPEFNLNDPLREEIYRNLYLYFAGSSKSCYELSSSILITGNLGVGKSVLLKTMQRVFPYHFYRLEAKRLKKLTIENGALQTVLDFGYNFKKSLLIDDLGTEDPQLKLWGNEPNTFQDIFYEREELFRDTHKEIKTHIVTNLSDQELIQNYTDRIFDRMIGMSKGNIIVWEGKSQRL